ncbi:MAG: hypothetical protein IGS03_17265 [Candidatus Sericytochromatia bacterium]|nr:hypothetical protein [Candidatus Sericytochromatia bacterium]
MIHPLSSQKYFWAVWSSVTLFASGAAPAHYGVEQTLHRASTRVNTCFSFCHELRLDIQQKTLIYRQIKRSELPEKVQTQIRQKMGEHRQQTKMALLRLGFCESDLKNLTDLKRRYRQLLRSLHPDHGGSADAFKAFYAACQWHIRRYQAAEMRSSN